MTAGIYSPSPPTKPNSTGLSEETPMEGMDSDFQS